MINITNANSVTPFNQFRYFRKGCSVSTSGRLGHFPDVKISKRPNVLPSIFIGGLGRSGRSDVCQELVVGRVNERVFPRM